MPTYNFTHPTTGRTVKVTGDTPPDEKTLDGIFADIDRKVPTADVAAGKPWAAPVSFGKPAPLPSGTRRDVMGVATLSERQTPVTGGILRKTYAGNLLAGPPLPSVNQLRASPMPTAEEQRDLVGKSLGIALGTNMDRRTIEPIVDAVKTLKNNLVMKGLPFSDKRNAYRAAQRFADAQTAGTPAAAAANAGRQADTKALVNRLNPAPTVTPTPGQAAGNYRSAALEQSMSAKDPAFAERLKYNDAELNKAAVNNLTRTLGKPVDLPATQPAAMTGEAQVKAIRGEMQPILSKEAEMWADVPGYAVPAGNTAEAFKVALSTPSTARKAVESVHKIFKQTPRTVEGLQTVEREINSAMKVGTDTDRHFLRQIKKAIADDFDAMGEAAKTGDVALHKGEIVYPSRLRAELAGIEERLAAVKEKPDVEAVRAALKKEGVHPAMYQKVDAKDAGADARAIDLFKKKFPDREVPVAGGGKGIADLTAKRATLQDQLANLQPADDVAAKYAAAKKYSREEKFERFYRGAVQDVLESGEQASGMRVPYEQVPAKFFTPQGSKDLIKAVGAEKAAEQSMPHAVEQLVSKTVNANTGVMDIPRAAAWVRQNQATLDNLGLTKGVNQVIKGQVPRAIEAELETKAVDVLGNPAATTLQAAKLVKRFGPSVERMYGAKGIQALRDYGQMMEIIGRNKHVSYAGGAITVEKSAISADMAEKVSTLAAVATGHGWVFSATKNIAKSLMGPALNFSKAQVNAILQEALVNPEAAAILMKIAKAKPEQAVTEGVKWIKPLIVQMQASGRLMARPPEEEPLNAE